MKNSKQALAKVRRLAAEDLVRVQGGRDYEKEPANVEIPNLKFSPWIIRN